jgi:hypothetical protein
LISPVGYSGRGHVVVQYEVKKNSAGKIASTETDRLPFKIKLSHLLTILSHSFSLENLFIDIYHSKLSMAFDNTFLNQQLTKESSVVRQLSSADCPIRFLHNLSW